MRQDSVLGTAPRVRRSLHHRVGVDGRMWRRDVHSRPRRIGWGAAAAARSRRAGTAPCSSAVRTGPESWSRRPWLAWTGARAASLAEAMRRSCWPAATASTRAAPCRHGDLARITLSAAGTAPAHHTRTFCAAE